MTDEPNKIGIEIHISDVLKINDRDFSITFSLYFNVQWLEPRLNLNPSFFQNRSVGGLLYYRVSKSTKPSLRPDERLPVMPQSCHNLKRP